jgi:hypothetical protein
MIGQLQQHQVTLEVGEAAAGNLGGPLLVEHVRAVPGFRGGASA